MHKITLLSALAAVMTLGVVTAASAQTIIASTGTYNSATQPFITYNSNSGLSILTSSAPADQFDLEGKVGQGVDNNVSIQLFDAAASPTLASYDPTTGFYAQAMSGGSFVITDKSTSTVLLAGTFGGSYLSGLAGATSVTDSFGVSSLTYGGSSGPGSFFPAGYSLTNGSLSIEMETTGATSVALNPITHAATLNPFSAGDQITFTATPTTAVPEPASFATFGIGAMVMLALGVAAKRRTSMVTAL